MSPRDTHFIIKADFGNGDVREYESKPSDLYERRQAELETRFPEWATATHLERQVMAKEKLVEGNPLDEQVGGSHYKTMKIQPIEFILQNNLGFCEGNIVKYTCRYSAKNGAEDLLKVVHYAQLLLAHKYGVQVDKPKEA